MRRTLALTLAGMAAAIGLGLLGGGVRAQAPATGPSFTQAQADQGAQVYSQHCGLCHGAHMDDGEFGPSLKGARFKRQWGGKSVGALFSYVTAAMPPGQAGTLPADDYAAVLAFVFQANGATAGAAPMPADSQALAGATVPN